MRWDLKPTGVVGGFLYIVLTMALSPQMFELLARLLELPALAWFWTKENSRVLERTREVKVWFLVT